MKLRFKRFKTLIMIKFQRSCLISIDRIWFINNRKSNCDIIRFLRICEPFDMKWYSRNEPHITVINDLSLNIDDILDKTSSTVKYEINKCLKENIEITFSDSNSISNDDSIIERFETAYREMAKSTNNPILVKHYNRKKIDTYLDNRILYISEASKYNHKVFHVYVAEGSNCVLLYSASNFRYEDKENRILIGRMNKFLHFNDMEKFKLRGVIKYDWGNIKSNILPNGIDKFKMSFGGDVVKVYNVLIGNTLIGKIAVFAIKILKL